MGEDAFCVCGAALRGVLGFGAREPEAVAVFLVVCAWFFVGDAEVKIRAIEITRAQRGWKCEVSFTEFSKNQFSAEEFRTIPVCTKWLLLSLWQGIREARRMAAKVRSDAATSRREYGWN